MSESFNHLIDTLSTEQYLQFLIDNMFSFYQDKPLKMSIYDTNKKLRFVTQQNLEFHKKTIPPYGELPEALLSGKPKINREFMQLIDLVIRSSTSITWIVFGNYNDHVGAIYIALHPLFFRDKVCGVLIKHTNFSKLFFGLVHITAQPEDAEKISANLPLELLSKREMEVLFLILFNTNMVEIGRMIGVSNKTARTYVTRICAKLSLPDNISTLETKLDKIALLGQLLRPELHFKPAPIFAFGEDELFFRSITELEKALFAPKKT